MSFRQAPTLRRARTPYADVSCFVLPSSVSLSTAIRWVEFFADVVPIDRNNLLGRREPNGRIFFASLGESGLDGSPGRPLAVLGHLIFLLRHYPRQLGLRAVNGLDVTSAVGLPRPRHGRARRS